MMKGKRDGKTRLGYETVSTEEYLGATRKKTNP